MKKNLHFNVDFKEWGEKKKESGRRKQTQLVHEL